LKIHLDDWQKEVLDTRGNIALRSGRQVGKSTVISIKAGDYAVKYPNKTVLIIASVERQAYLLFEKVMSYMDQNHKGKVRMGRDRPTKSKMKLKNGSTILCLPTGLSGHGIRGYTIDMLIADEAAFIPDAVWTAVTPMLAITKGDIILLSTPFGKGGYFYDCFEDESFTKFHVSSEDCPRKNQKFLDREKNRMSELQYAQEYLGEFCEELMQFFPSDLIRQCMTIYSRPPKSKKRYMGVDVARMGGDETVLYSVEKIGKKLYSFDMDVTRKTYLTETVQMIKHKDKTYNYKRIYIDDGGLGVGVFDPLLDDPQTRRKVVAINNAARSLDHEDRKKKLLKEDLYSNLLTLMEKCQIHLLNRPEVFNSLKSIQVEHKEGKMKIFGKYSHICEAIIRAAWCTKDKRLNIWVV